MFGDDDPEEGYDDTDPAEIRFRILRLWVASIALEAARGDFDHARVLGRIQAARWAAGLLRNEPLLPGHRSVRGALVVWLDELLEEVGV